MDYKQPHGALSSGCLPGQGDVTGCLHAHGSSKLNKIVRFAADYCYVFDL